MKSVSNFLGTLAGNIYGKKPGSANAAAAEAPNLRSRSGFKLDEGAFAHMQTNQYSFGTVSYPVAVDQMTENGHYIMFYVLENTGTKAEQGMRKIAKAKGEGTTEMREGLSTSKQQSGEQQLLIGGGTKEDASSALGRNSLTSFTKSFTRTSDVIIMYMPDQITDASQLDYSSSELGLAGAVVKQGIDTATRIAAAGGLSLATAMKEGGGLAKMVGGELAARGTKLLGEIGGGLGMGDVTGTINQVTGRVLNPHLEVLFKGVSMRKHGYTFTFTPKNEEEVKASRDIMKLFKFHAAPDFDKTTSGRFLRVPSMFEIHYMYQGVENSWLNLIPPVVCNNVQIDYASGGQYQTFRPVDGVSGNTAPPPTQIKMTLEFTETEIITKERVAEGF